ncbi:hypothetical protein [Marinobacter vinifirmus]|uniref:hypothetical protein n=1 Tax=Marinobacter vinifirmus TaxID=355591 RepID=UPI0012B695D7|nr:hypothetical protein [Marinobacter vinifirmus]
MKRLIYSYLLTIFFLFNLNSIALAQEAPLIAFSDIISGPSTGLGDGLGEGAIVTLWGYRFGDRQGEVFITDSSGSRKPAAHIYYWKKANGKSPSGPSDLYTSHQLYEIAFSIPESQEGSAKIEVISENMKSPPYPFTIRSGKIYHVKVSGDNESGDGSFSNPWAFVNGWPSNSSAAGNKNLTAGDLVYTHNVREPVYKDSTREVGMYLRALEGTIDSQIAIISYPGLPSEVVSAKWGISPYLSTGIVISKYKVLGGMLDDPLDDSETFGAGNTSDSTIQIRTSSNGRIIGNFISDIPGKCSNGWAGSIYSTRLDGSNVKVYGNFIYDIGCNQTSHFHHTTYMSKRTSSNEPESIAWEFGWNRLENNKSVFGIHFYDQSPFSSINCDPVTGTFNVHNNFIKNQRGSAINIYTSDYDDIGYCWNADSKIYNNIIINSGLGPVAEINNGTQPYAISIGGDIKGHYMIFNNLIFGVSDESSRKYETPAAFRLRNESKDNDVYIENNIVNTDHPIKMVKNESVTNPIYNNNIWFTGMEESASTSVYFEGVDNSLVFDPLIIMEDHLYLDPASPALSTAGGSHKHQSNFYGEQVQDPGNIGPVGPKNSDENLPSPPSAPEDLGILL